MILDQPTDESPRRSPLRLVETVLVLAILLAAIMRLLHLNWTLEVSSIAWIALGSLYLFAFYWVDTPCEKNKRSVTITMLYGIALGIGVFTVIIQNYFYREVYFPLFTVMVLISFMAIVSYDLITSKGKKRVASTRTYIRIALLVLIYSARTYIHLRYQL